MVRRPTGSGSKMKVSIQTRVFAPSIDFHIDEKAYIAKNHDEMRRRSKKTRFHASNE